VGQQQRQRVKIRGLHRALAKFPGARQAITQKPPRLSFWGALKFAAPVIYTTAAVAALAFGLALKHWGDR
jgi:hypothetical protein